MRNVRLRFWVECALAGLAAILAVLTAAWPNWIELLFGADPDGGDGSAEWGIVATLVVVAIIFAVLGRFEHSAYPFPPSNIESIALAHAARRGSREGQGSTARDGSLQDQIIQQFALVSKGCRANIESEASPRGDEQ